MAEATTANGATPATMSPGYRRYALMILVLGYTSSHVDRNIMGILLEPIKADLLLSDTQLGFLSGIAFAIFYATLGIPIALVADRGNRRNIVAWAIAIWSGMTALCGLAGSFWQLALARIGVGVGEAGSSPPSHSMIADMYAPNERASAMAIYSLGVYFGVMIGFLVGGWVAVWYGWRAAFFVVGLPGILLALLVRFTLREPARGGADDGPHPGARCGPEPASQRRLVDGQRPVPGSARQGRRRRRRGLHERLEFARLEREGAAEGRAEALAARRQEARA